MAEIRYDKLFPTLQTTIFETNQHNSGLAAARISVVSDIAMNEAGRRALKANRNYMANIAAIKEVFLKNLDSGINEMKSQISFKSPFTARVSCRTKNKTVNYTPQFQPTPQKSHLTY